MSISPAEIDFGPSREESRRRLWFVIGFAVMLMALDFAAGPYIQFPVLYILPVMLAAWLRGAGVGVVLGLVLSCMRFFFNWVWDFPIEFAPAVANTVMRGLVFIAISVATASVALHVRKLKQRVRQLEAQLPVCRVCGIIRRADGAWVNVSQLAGSRGHCMCPACEEKHYGSVA